MQLNNLIIAAVATLAGTGLALPTAGPFRVASASTPQSSAAPSSTAAVNNNNHDDAMSRIWPKIMSANSHGTEHGANQPKTDDARKNLCPSLCALQAQACVVALPKDEDFCWDTYIGCSDRC